MLHAGDLLSELHPGAPIDIRMLCAELWLLWSATYTDARLSRRMKSIRAWTRSWETHCRPSGADPLSEEALLSAVKHTKTHEVRSGRFTDLTAMIDGLGLMTPDLRRVFNSVRAGLLVLSTEFASDGDGAALRVSEVRRLVAAADSDDPADVVAVVLMLLLYESMARRDELTGANRDYTKVRSGLLISDIDLTSPDIRIDLAHPTRPGETRSCRLSPSASAWVRHWISIRGTDEGCLFFAPDVGVGGKTARSKQCAQRTGWNRLWRGGGLAERCGLKPEQVTVMGLRTGRATTLFEAGYSLQYIARSSSWTNVTAVFHALAKRFEMRTYMARRESHVLDWPLPTPSSIDGTPVQSLLF